MIPAGSSAVAGKAENGCGGWRDLSHLLVGSSRGSGFATESWEQGGLPKKNAGLLPGRSKSAYLLDWGEMNELFPPKGLTDGGS